MLFGVEAALLFVAPVVLLAILYAMLRRRVTLRTATLLVALFGYALLVLEYTLLPIVVGVGGTSSVESLLRNANFVPLRDLELGSRQFVGNLALGVPFGLLLPALARWERRPWPAVGAALAFGLGLELVQFAMGAARLIRFRSLDVNDALLNAVGALLGYAWFAAASAAIRWSGRNSAEPPSASAPA